MAGHDHLIDTVDEQDKVIGTATKHEAHQKGLRHRIVRVSVEDTNGLILLQKRHAAKKLYPDCWDNAASGHVESGEEYLGAAERELSEELGIVAPLTEVKYYQSHGRFEWRTLNRFNKLYKAVVPVGTTCSLQEDEVAEVRWVDRQELRELVQRHHDELADGLVEVYEALYS